MRQLWDNNDGKRNSKELLPNTPKLLVPRKIMHSTNSFVISLHQKNAVVEVYEYLHAHIVSSFPVFFCKTPDGLENGTVITHYICNIFYI